MDEVCDVHYKREVWLLASMNSCGNLLPVIRRSTPSPRFQNHAVQIPGYFDALDEAEKRQQFIYLIQSSVPAL